MIITLENLTKSFSTKDLFNNINSVIEDNDRIGLIGKNGCGKTTLLNIIYNDIQIDNGKVIKNKNKTIGFLAQNSGLSNENTIIQEMRTAFNELLSIEKKIASLRDILSTTNENTNEYKSISSEYSKLNTFFEQQDGYNIDYKIRRVLNGLGFMQKDEDAIVSTLSGGEKTRLALCKLLLICPDLLILDEPTNHLDIKALSWLEEYLNEYKGAILIVSHDRYFLDKTVNKIWEIENKKLNTYKGNYSKYLVLKKERIALQQKEYDKQQATISSMQEYIDKNMARASTTKMAQSRENALDRMEIIEKPYIDTDCNKLSFEVLNKSGFDAVKINNLSVNISDICLCNEINLDIKRGERIAIVGKNGAGKSTLLKTIVGQNKYTVGNIVFGKNISVGYYDQEHLQLNKENSVLEEVWTRFPTLKQQQIRNALGNVRIKDEEVLKKVGVISGGEKAKLLFCILMLSKPNLLVLDEPTNHLDLSTKEALENGLIDYEGTIIVVSHDRYFLNKIPDSICNFENKTLVKYSCKYDEFLIKQQTNTKEAEQQTSKTKNNTKEQKKFQAQKRQKISIVLKDIENIELEIKHIEKEIEDNSHNYIYCNECCEKLENLKNKQNELYEIWCELSDE